MGCAIVGGLLRRLAALSVLCACAALAACSSSTTQSIGGPLPGGSIAADPTAAPVSRDKLLIVSDSMKNEIIALPPYATSATIPAWVAHVAVGGKTYFPLNAVRDGSGRLYATMRTYPGIAIFDNPSSSPASASAVIAGPNTQLVDPIGIAVDAAGKIYVVDQVRARIVEFASGATGDAAPIALIAGSNTKVASPLNVVVDSSGNIFVADLAHGILEFPPGATGNVAPMRNITNSDGGITQVALDPKGDIYASSTHSRSIIEYAPDASGNATPIRVLSGGATDVDSPWALTICADDTLYVSNGGISPTSLRRILVFAPGWGIGTPDTPPRTIIDGGASQVTAPFGLSFY